jgi:hypothetical protein
MTKPRHHVGPLLVADADLSMAWARTVLHIVEHSGVEISPFNLSVNGFTQAGVPEETSSIRSSTDALLCARGYGDIEEVAHTIFPQRIWQLAQGDRHRLFQLYDDAFPRYQAIRPRDNRRGLYFQRLMCYGRGPCDGNQLEWILSQFAARSDTRRSMFQASVFDPGRDHVRQAQLQFPCLQQVSFVPTDQGLVVNAFYATQQLFVKAYGNYLGIARLGAFMAHEMKMPIARMNVTVGVAKLERISKRDQDLRALLADARRLLASRESGDDIGPDA